MSSPKVFIVNHNPSYNYEDAEQHGDLIFMTNGYIPHHKHEHAQVLFENYAKTADKNDFLLFSGTNILCALALTEWLKLHGEAKILHHVKGRSKDGNTNLHYHCYHVSTNGNESQAT